MVEPVLAPLAKGLATLRLVITSEIGLAVVTLEKVATITEKTLHLDPKKALMIVQEEEVRPLSFCLFYLNYIFRLTTNLSLSRKTRARDLRW